MIFGKLNFHGKLGCKIRSVSAVFGLPDASRVKLYPGLFEFELPALVNYHLRLNLGSDSF